MHYIHFSKKAKKRKKKLPPASKAALGEVFFMQKPDVKEDRYFFLSYKVILIIINVTNLTS
ncbi:hypothetical protein PSAB_14315 [Paenibacillus sabinae T27]|uniref:Uncharacterized protein n=1 Tax=Paenibacillus sabinae T27 TaxID=1268072 RepID=X5A1R7_9BACL|nr:hypothetical protein PSAB_14315 [Paenibacillus sabinae T27]